MAPPPPDHRRRVRVRAPAKINLALKVGPRRDDGFHPLATVFHAVSLFDEVAASSAEPGTFRVTVFGEGADTVPLDETNLAIRAARLLAQRHPAPESLGVSLQITKAIPVAGGLAGGSADGAAALVACAALWDLTLPAVDLHEIAAQLGSDVPFALLGGTAVGSGRGERLLPALATGTYHWVLAFGHSGLSTPAVYGRYDDLHPAGADPLEVPPALMNALRLGDPRLVGAALVNDLQGPALDLQPRLGQVLEAGIEYGAKGGVVSGSGPTCAFLADSESGAAKLAAALSAEGVCRAVRQASGPVPGARIVGTHT